MICQRCAKFECDRGYRYCDLCITVIQREMEETGYLTPFPRGRSYRPPGSKEDRNETKNGSLNNIEDNNYDVEPLDI